MAKTQALTPANEGECKKDIEKLKEGLLLSLTPTCVTFAKHRALNYLRYNFILKFELKIADFEKEGDASLNGLRVNYNLQAIVALTQMFFNQNYVDEKVPKAEEVHSRVRKLIDSKTADEVFGLINGGIVKDFLKKWQIIRPKHTAEKTPLI